MADADNELERARSTMDAGRYAEAYSILLPIAEAGNAEAQAIVGGMLHCGVHRYESQEQVNEDSVPAPDNAAWRADQEMAARFLQAASDAGYGVASFNLASMYVSGFGGGTWEERKAKAAALYRKGHDQGFTAFSSLMLGDGEGEPYFGLLESYAEDSGCQLPGEAPPS